MPPILPQMFNNAPIDSQKASEMYEDVKGRRGQINGLVYGCNQMPPRCKKGTMDNAKWMYVIRHNDSGKKKHIIEVEGSKGQSKIMVQYLPNDSISENITDPAQYFLENNNEVRDYKEFGEKGKMVMTGDRFDEYRGHPSFYVPKDKQTVEVKKHKEMFRKMEDSMNTLLLSSICEKTIKQEFKTKKGKN